MKTNVLTLFQALVPSAAAFGRIATLWLAGIGLALAQANSIEAFEVTQQAGKTVVRITTKEPLKSPPPNFAVATPARIAIDFPNTANALGRNSQDISQGELRSMNVVQGSDRTRLVLNLRRPVAHETAVEGRTVVVTLSEPPVAQTAPGGAVAHFAEGRADAKHAVRDIDFRRGRGGEGRIVVDLSDTSTGIDIRTQGQNIVVEFLKTTLPDNLRRRLDVVDFATPVNSISTFQQGDNVRMVIEPKGQWEHNAYQSDTQFVVEVKPVVQDTRAAQRGRYTGEKLSLNFQNVEVRAVLNVIADFTDLNIITSDTVSGNITLRLKDVPWDQALDIILQTRGLDSRRTGNVIWIAPRDELATREKLALEAQQQINDLEQTRTESFQMNYQKAVDVAKLLSDPAQRILSKRGSAVIDARTNTLFVQDVPSRLEEVRRLLAKIDVPVRQVMIEARIVEAADNFSKSLGARLGYTDFRFFRGGIGGSAIGGNGGPRIQFSGNREGIGLFTGQAEDKGTGYIPDSFMTNLPASGLRGFSAGQFAFSLFSNSMTRFINVELSALEADGKGKIISSPRVLTADNVEATIEQGTEIPYQTATSSGATALSFRKANLALKVKPQITPDGNIIMTLDVNKDAPGAQVAGGVQISTKHVKTEVLVENGGTVVIGGIYEQTDRTDITKVPLLGDLPYIGFLFKQDTRTSDKTELLVFITPRILNERLTIR
jgi:type IV pilus assembly protein PilQ